MIVISYLIANYNTSWELIRRTLTSITDQHKNIEIPFEIVFVDDGSEISPLPVIEEFNNYSINFIQKSSGGTGPGEARNMAIAAAKGIYLTFIDSDDFFFPDSLAPLLEILPASVADILTFGYEETSAIRIHRISQPAFRTNLLPSGADYMLKYNLMGANWGYIFKKSIVTDNDLLYIHNIYHQDEDFITRLVYHAGTMIRSNRIVYGYYRRADSIIRKNTLEMEQKRFDGYLTSFRSILAFREARRESDSQRPMAALDKKIAFLTVDLIIKINRCKIERKTFEKIGYDFMVNENLLPLPDRRYGFKYLVFRTMMGSKPGKLVLSRIISAL